MEIDSKDELAERPTHRSQLLREIKRGGYHLDDPNRRATLESETGADATPQFPNRASWLKDKLRERSWNKHDLCRHGGPDHKTGQKLFDGGAVREDVLGKVAEALSKNNGRVTVLDIPRD